MTQSVVVTGATGFVGQHVVAQLLREGVTVTALVRRDDVPLPPEVKRVAVPVLEAPAALPRLREALADADAVIHLAGRAHQIRDRAINPLDAFRRANVATTNALLDAMPGTSVRRVVLMSTVAAAVAQTEAPVTDDVISAPATPYGVSKREMECVALDRAPELGVQPILLRPPLVFGPGMKGNPLRLMRIVAARRPIPVSVPPSRRSAIYVGNLAQAIVLALRHPRVGSRPYFVSDGRAPTTFEFIEAMAVALAVRPRFLPMHRGLLGRLGRLGDAAARLIPFPFTSYEVGRLTASVEVDSSRFWHDLGAAPRHTMIEGMAATAAWFRSSSN